MALLRDLRMSVTGREWTEADVARALVDNRFTPAEASAMWARGASLHGTRMRFVFERALAADPLCLTPANTTLGAIGMSAVDIAPGTYAACLGAMPDAPRVLVVRADTGFGKTQQCRSLLSARAASQFPFAANFVDGEVALGGIGVASTIAETRALYEACVGCGYECVLYQDRTELAGLRHDHDRRRRTLVFTTYHSLVKTLAILCNHTDTHRAEQRAMGEVVTGSTIEMHFDRMVAAHREHSYYVLLSFGFVIIDESHRVLRGVTAAVLCNARETYTAILTIIKRSDSTVIMSANSTSAEINVATRAVGTNFALYWHHAEPRPRLVTMHETQATFVAHVARAVYRSKLGGGATMLLVDNKRTATQIVERIKVDLGLGADRVLLLCSPSGLDIIANLARGDFSDLVGKALIVATPVLSAAVSIFGVIEHLFMLCMQIVEVTTVQQMLARLRRDIHGGFRAHVFVLFRKSPSASAEPERERPEEGSMHAFYAGKLKEFYRKLGIGARCSSTRAAVFMHRIDVQSVHGVVNRALASQFNAALARGLHGVAGVCHEMLEDPCYSEFVSDMLGVVHDAEYRAAVVSDLETMGYTVSDAVTELALMPDEARVARGLERILLRRRLSKEEEAKYNVVVRALKQVYSLAPNDDPAEHERRLATVGQLCAAFNWAAVPADELEAHAMLSTVCPRLTDQMDAAPGSLTWICTVESLYARQEHAHAMRGRNMQGHPYFLDPIAVGTHALTSLLDAVRRAACSCNDYAANGPPGPCAQCRACDDAPLGDMIRLDTAVSKDAPVDSAAIIDYLAENVCTDDAFFFRNDKSLCELSLTPLGSFTWHQFMQLFTAVVLRTTGVKWQARFVRSVQNTNRVSFAMHASSLPGVRFYAEALRTRSSMERDAPFAPRVCGDAYRARIAQLHARLGPFAPISGTF
jgi:hypothetical protein